MLLPDYLDRGMLIAPDAPAMVAPDGSTLMTHRQLSGTLNAIVAHVKTILSRDN